MQRYSEYRPTGFDSKGLGLDDRQDWRVVDLIQTRDSGPLEQSNFACAERELDKVDPEGEDHETHRFGHWGPGWFEILLVKPGTQAETVATEIEAALADYPVLSDDDYSKREWEEAVRVWDCMGLRGRIEACAKFRVSIFAARRDEIPQDETGELVSYLAE